MQFTITGHEAWARAGDRLPAIKSYVHKQLIRLWKDCILVFMDPILIQLSQHVDTGMSIASMRPIVTAARHSGRLPPGVRSSLSYVNMSGAPKPGHKKVPAEFSDNIGPFKSAAFGEQLGQKAFTVSFGTPSAPNLEFTFRIAVYQHYINEFGLASLGPWHALSEGQTAFVSYWETHAAEYISAKYILEMIFGEANAEP